MSSAITSRFKILGDLLILEILVYAGVPKWSNGADSRKY